VWVALAQYLLVLLSAKTDLKHLVSEEDLGIGINSAQGQGVK
jgi:hypothetical protein